MVAPPAAGCSGTAAPGFSACGIGRGSLKSARLRLSAILTTGAPALASPPALTSTSRDRARARRDQAQLAGRASSSVDQLLLLGDLGLGRLDASSSFLALAAASCFS